MWLTLYALFIALVPFILLFGFKDRLKGFLYILTGSIGLHLALGLVTQALHIFTYKLIISTHTLIAIVVVCFFFYRKIRITRFKLNWVAISAMLIIFFELWSVHYSYNGSVDSLQGIRIIENSSYVYPLFSDEWATVSLANYSIESKSLPQVNPLNENKPFTNFLTVFHSLIAEIILFLNIDSFTNFVWLAIANGLLTSLLLFILLRLLGVRNFSSAVSILMLPLLTNSGNLPGFWFLLPYNASFTVLLLALIGFVLKDRLLIGASLFISLLLYPPMIVFILPLIILEFRWKGLAFLCVACAMVFIIGLGQESFRVVFQKAYSFLVRKNLDNGIINFLPWFVIPLYILPFSAMGLWRLYKEKIYSLLFPIIGGLLYWVMYSKVLAVILIESPRIVAISSFLLVASAGFGLDFFSKKFLRLFEEDRQEMALMMCKIFVLCFFLITAYNFPGKERWSSLAISIKTPEGVAKAFPTPPVNHHLKEDELVIFKKYEEKRFISPPWKGLVLGVTTKNLPLHTKASISVNKILEYEVFMESECKKKEELALKYKIDLVYSIPFTCEKFRKMDQSSEGLSLYSFTK